MIGEMNIRKYLWVIVPIVSVGGLFYPLAGLLMIPMMTILLLTSLSKARYWCGNLCPRGSFLDQIIRKFSISGKAPAFLISPVFRYGFLLLFLGLLAFRLGSVILGSPAWALPEKLGFVFATLCLVTTTAAVVLGIVYSPRTWCSFCPMGTLQTEIYRKTREK